MYPVPLLSLTYVTQQNQTSGAMANPLIGRQEVAMNPEFVADIKRKHKAGRIAGSWWVKTDNYEVDQQIHHWSLDSSLLFVISLSTWATKKTLVV